MRVDNRPWRANTAANNKSGIFAGNGGSVDGRKVPIKGEMCMWLMASRVTPRYAPMSIHLYAHIYTFCRRTVLVSQFLSCLNFFEFSGLLLVLFWDRKTREEEKTDFFSVLGNIDGDVAVRSIRFSVIRSPFITITPEEKRKIERMWYGLACTLLKILSQISFSIWKAQLSTVFLQCILFVDPTLSWFFRLLLMAFEGGDLIGWM